MISAIAIYFITWWICLFAVLPWGVRNAHEAGEGVEPGNEAGAPVDPFWILRIVRRGSGRTPRPARHEQGRAGVDAFR